VSSLFRARLTGERASGEALSYTRFAEGSYQSYFFAIAQILLKARPLLRI